MQLPINIHVQFPRKKTFFASPNYFGDKVLNLNQANRKRRPAAGTGRNNSSAAEPQVSVMYGSSYQNYWMDDPQKFWANSNARLGMDPDMGLTSNKRSKVAFEYPCAICGAMVMVERNPKHRYEVRCDSCRQKLDNMLTPEDRECLAAEAQRLNASRNVRDGLPDLTEEDLEALNEMRVKSNMGNGRSGNVLTVASQELPSEESHREENEDLESCCSVLDDLISED